MSVELTEGGISGHILRRICHVAILLVPLVYYVCLPHFFSIVGMRRLLVAFIAAITLIEFLRVRYQFVFFGQRQYEADRISAFAWTMISLALVLFFSPSEIFSFTIILVCALVDPLMGEMRLRGLPLRIMIAVGTMAVFLLWWYAATYYPSIPHWFAFVLAPITILVELPTFRWIDDNALMLLIPLGTIILLH